MTLKLFLLTLFCIALGGVALAATLVFLFRPLTQRWKTKRALKAHLTNFRNFKDVAVYQGGMLTFFYKSVEVKAIISLITYIPEYDGTIRVWIGSSLTKGSEESNQIDWSELPRVIEIPLWRSKYTITQNSINVRTVSAGDWLGTSYRLEKKS